MSELSSLLTERAARRQAWRDRVALAALGAAVIATASVLDVHSRLHRWSEQNPGWDPFVLLPVVMGVAVVSVAYLVVTRRRLRRALREIDMLSGLLAMCASCKRIRGEDDQWEPVEAYLQRRGEVSITHGLCPECASRLYPGVTLTRTY